GRGCLRRPIGHGEPVGVGPVEHLKDDVYGGFHRDVFRRRKEWFGSSAVVLWWVDPGERPSLGEGKSRLDHYLAHGASDTGFGFRDVGRVNPPGRA
ncbi:MAG: DUF3291 domain-containing protein, partial [Actinomycetota bacterium]